MVHSIFEFLEWMVFEDLFHWYYLAIIIKIKVYFAIFFFLKNGWALFSYSAFYYLIFPKLDAIYFPFSLAEANPYCWFNWLVGFIYDFDCLQINFTISRYYFFQQYLYMVSYSLNFKITLIFALLKSILPMKLYLFQSKLSTIRRT